MRMDKKRNLFHILTIRREKNINNLIVPLQQQYPQSKIYAPPVHHDLEPNIFLPPPAYP